MTHEEVLKAMHTGEIYNPSDELLAAEQLVYLDRLQEYNSARPSDLERRRELLSSMFASFGEGSYIEQPFYANWAGRFVHIGKGVYANFGLTLVDDTAIHIDDQVMIGPRCTITTATHPIDPALRAQALQSNHPVHLCRNVWLAAGVIVGPGVTIGENSVIGAGSVVLHDIPADVLAAGVPCRVIRELTAEDR